MAQNFTAKFSGTSGERAQDIFNRGVTSKNGRTPTAVIEKKQRNYLA
jgi:hypothetical protein